MYHSKNWPISSSLFTLLVCSCCSGLSWSSVFLWCWLLLLFHFSHYWSGPSPFFSRCIWLKMQQFYLFKEPAFSLTDLSYFYLVSISFSSAVCMIFFLLLTLGFVCCSFYSSFRCKVGFPGSPDSKASACNAGDLGSIPGSGRSLEKEMATHSSTLAWKIPWMEEPGRLQSMGSQRVGHDWTISLTLVGCLRFIFFLK